MDKTDIIIFGGQSNMQGQTECLSNDDVVKNAFEYKWISDELIPLKNPVGECITKDGKQGDDVVRGIDAMVWLNKHVFGASCYGFTNLVPEFCKAYTNKCQRNVVAVHAAKGSTVIAQWLDGTIGYEFIVKKSKAAIQKASQTYNIGKIYFVWLQGESDAIEGNSKEYYKEKIAMLAQSLKQSIGIDKFAVIRVGKFTNDARDDEIINAQDEICMENDNFVMLTREATVINEIAEYMNPEVGGHYSAKGLEYLGRIAGEKLGEISI